MVCLILGGLSYILGNIIWIAEYERGIANWIIASALSSIFAAAFGEGTCDNYDADTYQNVSMMIAIAECLLAGVTSIIFGIDCWKQILNQHKKRMYLQ